MKSICYKNYSVNFIKYKCKISNFKRKLKNKMYSMLGLKLKM